MHRSMKEKNGEKITRSERELRKTEKFKVKYMGRTLLVLLVMMLSMAGYARKQGQELIDSLQRELRTNLNKREDSIKVKVLNRISHEMRATDPDEGLKYADMALQLAEKLNWKPGISTAYSFLANNYDSKSDFSKALEYN